MNDHSKKVRNRRARHIMIVLTLLFLICAVGALAFDVSNEIAVQTLSKLGTHTIDANHAALSSAELNSQMPVSSEQKSNSSETSSKPFVSSSPNSSLQSAVSSTPPMNPAIYQAMYPNLYAEKTAIAAPISGKIVYLTFDDGPSNLTIPLLNILDQHKVRATFFLVGKTDAQSLNAMKAIVDRGDAIGVHSYTHQYQQIYASPKAFLDDFARMHDLIQNTTGIDTHIYRYAGGSVNSYNKNTARAIISEMNRRGYTYYDWNVSSGDAEHGATAQSIYYDTIRGVHGHSHSIILFHNTKYKGNTLSQMSKIIETLQKEGYQFETLDPSVDNQPYVFPVPAQE